MTYHFTESGLKNVWLANGYTLHDVRGKSYISFDDPDGLHAAIAETIAELPRRLKGDEVRFMRTTLKLAQWELARRLGVSDQSVARWEKGRAGVAPEAERLMRLLVLDRLGKSVRVGEFLNAMAQLDEADAGAAEQLVFEREADDGWELAEPTMAA